MSFLERITESEQALIGERIFDGSGVREGSNERGSSGGGVYRMTLVYCNKSETLKVTVGFSPRQTASSVSSTVVPPQQVTVKVYVIGKTDDTIESSASARKRFTNEEDLQTFSFPLDVEVVLEKY